MKPGALDIASGLAQKKPTETLTPGTGTEDYKYFADRCRAFCQLLDEKNPKIELREK
jgi:hypothetical protein